MSYSITIKKQDGKYVVVSEPPESITSPDTITVNGHVHGPGNGADFINVSAQKVNGKDYYIGANAQAPYPPE